jgi:hypothetical protein
MERWRWCVVITPPPLFFVMWPKLHFRVMSSTSKITKGDKQMYLMWTVPINHLRHAFIQCCASFPLLRREHLYAMAASIKNMDSAVTWLRYQTKKSEGSRVPDYIYRRKALHFIVNDFGNLKRYWNPQERVTTSNCMLSG